jgi:hypothetical protein
VYGVGKSVVSAITQTPASGPREPVTIRRDRCRDQELAQIIVAAREMPPPYGGIIEFLALTGLTESNQGIVRGSDWQLLGWRFESSQLHHAVLRKQRFLGSVTGGDLCTHFVSPIIRARVLSL